MVLKGVQAHEDYNGQSLPSCLFGGKSKVEKINVDKHSIGDSHISIWVCTLSSLQGASIHSWLHLVVSLPHHQRGALHPALLPHHSCHHHHHYGQVQCHKACGVLERKKLDWVICNETFPFSLLPKIETTPRKWLLSSTSSMPCFYWVNVKKVFALET